MNDSLENSIAKSGGAAPKNNAHDHDGLHDNLRSTDLNSPESQQGQNMQASITETMTTSSSGKGVNWIWWLGALSVGVVAWIAIFLFFGLF
ncbi:MAG: hypothetical protein V7676_04020 [Parasphingorhabdus sp.]|uniref:hypothetical protein n=1 Tax=Parasphingorhabdus sp. TaxID=2709688 RepID=UPI0030034EA9